MSLASGEDGTDPHYSVQIPVQGLQGVHFPHLFLFPLPLFCDLLRCLPTSSPSIWQERQVCRGCEPRYRAAREVLTQKEARGFRDEVILAQPGFRFNYFNALRYHIVGYQRGSLGKDINFLETNTEEMLLQHVAAFLRPLLGHPQVFSLHHSVTLCPLSPLPRSPATQRRTGNHHGPKGGFSRSPKSRTSPREGAVTASSVEPPVTHYLPTI